MKRQRPSRRAFTLVEIMVAIAVFTLVITAIYTSWVALMRATTVAQDVAAQAQRQRVTLHSIEDALMAIQSFQASPQYYSFVVENGSDASLAFTARVPEVFPRNGKFFNPVTGKDFNLRRLLFSLEPDGIGEKRLVLRQKPILMELDPDERTYPTVLARNVRKLEIECWDPLKQEWADEWKNTNAIPVMVRLRLVTGANTFSAAAPQVTVTRIYSLPSQTMPAGAQGGPGAAPPGAPGAPGAPGQIQVPGVPQAPGKQLPIGR